METINIFKEFVLTMPVKTPLAYGHNDNIVIESADFGIRKNKGVTVKSNSFIKLTKIDPETKQILANTEIRYFNLDPGSDFVAGNFNTQFTNFAGIVEAVGGDVQAFADGVEAVLGDSSDEFVLKSLKDRTKCAAIQQSLMDGLETALAGKIGIDSTLLKCKMASNKGGFLNPGEEYSWILPMDSEESLPAMTSRENGVRRKAMAGDDDKSTADSTGSAPEKDGLANNSLDSI